MLPAELTHTEKCSDTKPTTTNHTALRKTQPSEVVWVDFSRASYQQSDSADASYEMTSSECITSLRGKAPCIMLKEARR